MACYTKGFIFPQLMKRGLLPMTTYEDLDFYDSGHKSFKTFKLKKDLKGSFMICNEISLENELLFMNFSWFWFYRPFFVHTLISLVFHIFPSFKLINRKNFFILSFITICSSSILLANFSSAVSCI
jgi:hypothetical protein